MYIIRCMKEWEVAEAKSKDVYGREELNHGGFIHCSSIEFFWRVAPNFVNVEEQLYIALIDLNRVKSEVRWEDLDGVGRAYPHIYGELNTDAIIEYYKFMKESNGAFKLNPELRALIEEEC